MELTSKAAAELIAYTTDSIDKHQYQANSYLFLDQTFLTNCPSMYLTLIFESLRYTRPLLPYTIHQYIKWSSSHTHRYQATPETMGYRGKRGGLIKKVSANIFSDRGWRHCLLACRLVGWQADMAEIVEELHDFNFLMVRPISKKMKTLDVKTFGRFLWFLTTFFKYDIIIITRKMPS